MVKITEKGIKIYPRSKINKMDQRSIIRCHQIQFKNLKMVKVYNQYMKFDYIKSLYFLFLLSYNYLKKNKWK